MRGEFHADGARGVNLPHRAVRGPGPLDYFPQGPGVTAVDREAPRAQPNINTN
jgi:hypothetical protein